MNQLGHPTRLIKPPKPVRPWLGRKPVPIDEAITGLIRTCWELGITTVSSCQQGLLTGATEISFRHHRDLVEFLNQILGKPPADMNDILRDDLASRMRNWAIAGAPVMHPSRMRWEFICVPDTYTRWGLFAEVRFPRSDIGEVERRLRAALARGKPCERIPA